jgi:hypothetical protein
MTVVARSWRDVPPNRRALAQVDFEDDAVWSRRLWSDRQRAVLNQTDDLLAVTAAVEARSRELGAEALILSGSTARGRRTCISDLDYHVIGARPLVNDLPEDIDLYTDTPASFEQKLRTGDDFAHWSVWYGCVLFDSGVVRAGAMTIARDDLWPDPARKLEQARTSLEFAEKMAKSGDHDAALEQVRAALSLVGRWWLLKHEVFPLARDELSAQLSELGQGELAEGLYSCIHAHPPATALQSMVTHARALAEAHAHTVKAPID